mgnify:CR=1
IAAWTSSLSEETPPFDNVHWKSLVSCYRKNNSSLYLTNGQSEASTMSLSPYNKYTSNSTTVLRVHYILNLL